MRIVDADDLVDRGCRPGRAGRLRTPGSPRTASDRSRAGSAARRSSRARPACPMGRRSPRAPSCWAISICGSRNAKRSSSVRRAPCGDQSSMLAPRMLTRPPTAARRSPKSAASPSLRPGKERHSCPGSASISTARPSSTIPTAMSTASRSPTIISGVQLKALAVSTQPAGSEPSLTTGAASLTTAAGTCGASSTSDCSARNGSVSGPSGPTCR